MEQANQANGIADTLDVFKGHFLSIWRFRWTMVVAAIVVTVIGLPAVNFVPDKYAASTRLFVDTQTMLKPVLKGLAVESDIALQFADITRRTMLNTTNVERIMREADLDLAVSNNRERERLIDELKNSISLTSYGGDKRRRQVDNFYEISYAHNDPRKAYAVVQSVLDIFIENSLGASRKDTSMTESFLNEQIKEYERRLSAAEEELKIFKQENINLMPNQAGGYFTQLSNAKETLRLAELELKEAQERSKQLQAQIDDLVKGMSGNVGGGTSSLDIRISNMEKQLDDLLLQYTERHPNVVSLREAIAQLTKKRQEEFQQGSESGTPSGLMGNKLYQELTVEQGRAKANVSALQVRVTEYRSEAARLSRLIDTIPDVEARLAQLNRDYEINKEKYGSLVSRRESASISKKAEVSADQVVFKVIEAPKVPVGPISPNRPLLLIAVYAASLGVGALLAWLLGQLKPTIMNAKDLKDKFGFPVLGTVSVVMTEKQKKYERRKLIAFIGVLIIHFGISITIVASQFFLGDPLGLAKLMV